MLVITVYGHYSLYSDQCLSGSFLRGPPRPLRTTTYSRTANNGLIHAMHNTLMCQGRLLLWSSQDAGFPGENHDSWPAVAWYRWPFGETRTWAEGWDLFRNMLCYPLKQVGSVSAFYSENLITNMAFIILGTIHKRIRCLQAQEVHLTCPHLNFFWSPV